MISYFLRKRKHIKFVHSRIYDLKYEILNQSLKMTSIDDSVDLYQKFKDIRVRAELFKKYQRRLKLLRF
jgi:hypothetical protein